MNQVSAVLADISPCLTAEHRGEKVGVGFFLELSIGACGEAQTNGGYLLAFLRASALKPAAALNVHAWLTCRRRRCSAQLTAEQYSDGRQIRTRTNLKP